MSLSLPNEFLPTSTVAVSENKELPTIILDSGHGGMDGGCVAYNGVAEKGINLNIMLDLKIMLETFGYNVIVTRDSDVSIHDEDITGLSNQKKSDMAKRLDIFNSSKNSIAISIHQNQFTDSRYSGAQMFYSQTNPKSEILATTMQKAFVDNLQPNNEREIKISGKELYLIYFCKSPSIMIECGFLSNPEEANKLQTEEYQQEVAFTIFKGINDYCGV
ncbi:MAG: cell wall hydrolase [Clostridiales bacterium]|nr:cell wall hydrolase [Clostridiales bacterium]